MSYAYERFHLMVFLVKKGQGVQMHLIPLGREHQMPQPAEQGVALENGLLPADELSGQPGRIAIPMGARGKRFMGIEPLDHPGGVAGRKIDLSITGRWSA